MADPFARIQNQREQITDLKKKLETTESEKALLLVKNSRLMEELESLRKRFGSDRNEETTMLGLQNANMELRQQLSEMEEKLSEISEVYQSCVNSSLMTATPW
jgi:predicted nuclease with TOPRIM domain